MASPPQLAKARHGACFKWRIANVCEPLDPGTGLVCSPLKLTWKSDARTCVSIPFRDFGHTGVRVSALGCGGHHFADPMLSHSFPIRYGADASELLRRDVSQFRAASSSRA